MQRKKENGWLVEEFVLRLWHNFLYMQEGCGGSEPCALVSNTYWATRLK